VHGTTDEVATVQSSLSGVGGYGFFIPKAVSGVCLVSIRG
jgi:hypothetical protein